MKWKIFLYVTIILFAILILCLIFPIVLSIRSRRNKEHFTITQWCDKTPYPKPCKHFTSHNNNNNNNKSDIFGRSDFRDLLIHAAMDRALEAHRHAHLLAPTSDTEPPRRTAWADCVKLYDDTIFHLNRTLYGLSSLRRDRPCTAFDAQTWLSSAMTNIDTCLSGSNELNVTGFIYPITTGFNVTELISNSLAINARLVDSKHEALFKDDEFPRWVSSEKRRLLEGSEMKANLVVSKDGSGHFGTVQAAINAAARRRVKGRFVIHVKRGVYRENIEVGVGNNNVVLVGDGMRFTIITSARSVFGGYTTFSSATAGIDGLRFAARGITFQNTAGPQKGQAVALRSTSDLSVFYRCAFEGYQDTLMVQSQRQFYKECYIYGTVDFIFGNAAVVFQNCIINVRKPIIGQVNVITAQGRNDPYQNTAITIQNSQIRAAADFNPVAHNFKTYLGRPWKLYSRTVFMKCYLDKLVSPLGWLEWHSSGFGLKTLYYGEYRNIGPGSSTRQRVQWPGFHVITTRRVASQFTAGSLIAGKSWLPATGVPYLLGI